MNQYAVAGQGLKKMFIAAVGALVCSVVALIPLIGVIAGIGSLVFLVISLVGLYEAGKQIEGCKKAFTLQIIVLICSVLLAIIGLVPFLGTLVAAILGIGVSVISFLAVYSICTSVAAVLSQVGDADAAKAGELAWKIQLACTIVSIVATLLGWIPVISSLVGLVSTIVGIVGSVFYIIFLSKSSNRLGA